MFFSVCGMGAATDIKYVPLALSILFSEKETFSESGPLWFVDTCQTAKPQDLSVFSSTVPGSKALTGFFLGSRQAFCLPNYIPGLRQFFTSFFVQAHLSIADDVFQSAGTEC